MVFSYGLHICCLDPKKDQLKFKYINLEFKQNIIKKLNEINKAERTIFTKKLTIQTECNKPNMNVCSIHKTNLSQLYEDKNLLEKEFFNLYFDEI